MSSSTTSHRQGSVAKRAGLTIALALGVLAVVPAIASAAGLVSTAGTVITYTGDAGVNSVTSDDAGANSYTFAETGITDTSASCTTAANVTTCTVTAWTSIVMNMGAGIDTATTARSMTRPTPLSHDQR